MTNLHLPKHEVVFTCGIAAELNGEVILGVDRDRHQAGHAAIRSRLAVTEHAAVGRRADAPASFQVVA